MKYHQAIPAKERIKANLPMLIKLGTRAGSVKLRCARVRALQSGGYVSRFKGRGMEFDETRLYQPGDDIRMIDWKVTARTGKPHTKLFREERERPVFISVDARKTMHFATRGVFKSVQAAKLAALLAWAAQQQGDRVGGQAFSESSCQETRPGHGKSSVLHFLKMLVTPPQPLSDGIDLEQTLARLVKHARPGSRVFIISDFRGIEAGENHLVRLSRHCEVVLIHVFDPLESHLPQHGRYRFTDGEKERVIDTTDRQLIMQYQQRFQTRQNFLRQLSRKHGMTLIQCCTTDDPVDVLR